MRIFTRLKGISYWLIKVKQSLNKQNSFKFSPFPPSLSFSLSIYIYISNWRDANGVDAIGRDGNRKDANGEVHWTLNFKKHRLSGMGTSTLHVMFIKFLLESWDVKWFTRLTIHKRTIYIITARNTFSLARWFWTQCLHIFNYFL